MPPAFGDLRDAICYGDTRNEMKLNAPDDYVTIRINKNDSAVDILETILDAIE